MSQIVQICIMVLLSQLSNQKLIQVIQVFRHGARYWIDDSPQSGQLLTSGMRQHYNLGVQLRQEYIEELQLLDSTYNHTQIYVVSTDVNRTIDSAQCQLLGMFPHGPTIPVDIREDLLLPPYAGAINYLNSREALPNFHQAIPIHVGPDSYQILLPECSGGEDLQNQDKLGLQILIDDFEVKTEAVRMRLCSLFNTTDCSSESVSGLFSDYSINSFRGLPVPNITKEDYRMFQIIKGFTMYGDDAGQQFTKYMSQPFYTDVLRYLSDKVQNPQSSLKWISYSAHDTNLVLYASLLNISNAQCLHASLDPSYSGTCQMAPQFASNMIYELHETGRSFHIKVKYDGAYQKICGGGLQCPFEQFKKRILSSIATEQEFTKVCGEKIYVQKQSHFMEESSLNDFSQTTQLKNSILIILFLIIIALSFYVMKRDVSQKNDHTLSQALNENMIA